MQHSDFLHMLDQWLAPRGGSSAVEPDGLIQLDMGEDTWSIHPRDDGTVEVFVGVGHGSRDRLRTLFDEDDMPENDHELECALEWQHTAMARCAIEVRMSDGLVILSQVLSPTDSLAEWESAAGSFEELLVQWRNRLILDE